MAEYVLAHQFRVATMTIDEFAAAVGVSVATANRFARALELPGYPQFRARAGARFRGRAGTRGKLRTELAHSASAVQIFAATLEEDIRNAQRNLQGLDAEACEQAVDIILGADRVFIIGFGASGFLAGMLQRGLCMHLHSGRVARRPRRRIPRRPPDVAHDQQGSGHRHRLPALPGRHGHAGQCGQAGRRAGAGADRQAHAAGAAASVVLYAVSTRQLIPNSETAALGLIEALSAAVAYRAKNSVAAAAGVTSP